MDLELRDRVFIITGGARGLGRATAECLVAEGARVVLSGRDGDSLTAAEAELGDAAVSVVADNADPGTPARLLAAARDTWGQIDGALISVGGPPKGPVHGHDRPAVVGRVRLGLPGRGPAGSRDRCRAAARGSAGHGAVLERPRARSAEMAISNGLRPGPGDGGQAARRRAGPARRTRQRPAAGPGRPPSGWPSSTPPAATPRRRGRRPSGRSRWAATASRRSSAGPRRSCSRRPRRSSAA